MNRVHGSRGGHTTPQGGGAEGLLPAAVSCHGQPEAGDGSAGPQGSLGNVPQLLLPWCLHRDSL